MVPTVRSAGRPTAVVVWSTAAVATAAAGEAAWLGLADAGGGGPVKPLAMTAIWLVPGVVVTLARPRIALGWLALGEALLFAASAWGDAWVRSGTRSGADVAWAAWLTDRFSAFLAVGIWLVLVLLPDGRLPSRRWRPVVAGVVGIQCLALTAFATVRGPAAVPGSTLPAYAREPANPLGVLPTEVGRWLEGMDAVLLQLPLLICLVAYVVRLRRAGPEERVRVVAVLLAAATCVLLVVLGHAWWPQAGEVLDVAAAALLAVQLTVTVLGARPHAAVVAVRQGFVYTVLTAVVGGLAVLAVSALERLEADQPTFGIAVIAGATALAVHPLRVRLARLVDRLLFGDVHDPYRALQRLAEHTHRAPTVDAVLAGLAATAAASLRMPWSSAESGGHHGSWGERPAGAVETSTGLVSGATPIGTLRVGGRRLRAEEERLLADLGRHGGVAVQAALLSGAIQAGRQRVVVAREEERRRLRRDLHDEVGATLAGLTMQLGTVRALVHEDADAADGRLLRLQDAARDALDTVRRVSHGLRPPALDELGLAGALRQLAESLGLAARFPEDDPPRLPAAVEVAGYLIGAEALHNVARHAGTTGAEVVLAVEDDELVVRVCDDGAGLDGTRPGGVGLQAMRERADELGGSLQVLSGPGRGTTVIARLPTGVAASEVAR
ncbi:UNVERIFIED_ORG: sensor histidine kinase [Bacillus sp. AZ43]